MRAFLATLLAGATLLVAAAANGGSLHPDLEARLAALPPDAQIPVIVELTAKADTNAAAKSLRNGHRRERAHAVVAALRDVAERTQPAVKAHLAKEQADGAVRKVRSFWVINGFAVTASEKAIRRLAKRDDVGVIRLDAAIPPPRPRPLSGPSTLSTESAWNIDQIRAPEVWAFGPGYTGTGIVVGSFDTGVDGDHPDLAPRYRGNDAISWFDPYGEHSSPYDNNGHGTHTVGTMVGGDVSGFNIGVAPGAQWIAAKAWNDADDATESAFHAIFEWFLAPGGDPANAPDVVNSSWGLDPALCFPDFRADVQAMRAAGIVPVFASGNGGPDAGTILAPGSYAESFTVGSTGFSDEISDFSSEGPSPCDGAVKPNISAPGEFILSTFPGGDYVYLDGTSMATPHVSGAAALMLSIDPSMTVDEVEAALTVGAVDLGPPGADNAFGAGRVDLVESMRLVLGLERIGVAATTPRAYEAGTVPGVFTFTRTGSTTDPITVTYTVTGTATPGADYAVLPGSITIPSGSATATLVVAPVDDDFYEHDETVIVTLDPHPDFVMSPRAAAVTIVSDDLPPDLIVTTMAAPDMTGVGESITMSDTTRNLGTGNAQASTTTYYLTVNNPTLDAADIVLGSRAVPALGPGASNSGSVTVTIPPGTPTGSFYFYTKTDSADGVLESDEFNNTNYHAVRVGPDLSISSLSAPSTGGAGATLTVTDTTRNLGGGAAPATNTRYYLSHDYTLDAGDVLLGSRAVGPLAAGASNTGSATLAIPADTLAGSYYVVAKADGDNALAETNETNNAYGVYISIGADLMVTTFTAPTDAGAGLAITLTDTTKNQGTGAAAASTTSYYLSTNNATLDAADVLLGSRAVPALAANASDTGSVSVTIPAGTPTGAWYVYAKADAGEVVSETSEFNNTANRQVRVGPDLTVSALSAPANAGAGASIAVADTTRNAGGGAAPATLTRFYLSSDYALSAGDVLLGSRAVAALAGGASDSGSVTLTIPAGTAGGNYYVLAKADGDDALIETQETNNVYGVPITIGSDLTVTAFNAPSDTGAGLSITVTDTTKNQGFGTAPASTTGYYLSTNNATLDAADVLLGSRAVPALAAGSSDSGSVTITIPAGTPTGSFYLYVKADSGEVVSETSEFNNTSSRAIRVGPDLFIASLAAPAAAGAGATISVSDTTRNLGGGMATATSTRYYLSPDYALGPTDVPLGSRAVAPLAPGASDAAAVTLTIPAGTVAGNYYVLAKADGDDALVETNETNNVYGVPITVGADLIVTAVTGPTDSGAGLTITLGDTTKNQGAGAAPASSTTYYLSTNNATLDAADIVLGSRAVPALAANASDTGSVTVTIPAGTPTGTFYIYAKADGGDVIAETSETNNTNYRSIRIGPDLLVTGLTAPSISGAGATITVTDTTRNQGGGVAPTTNTRYYLSTDFAVNAGDVLLGARAVSALASGTSETGSVAVTIPAGTAPGAYYILAKADGDDALAEIQETNNVFGVAITIGSDLVVTSFTGPDAAGAGMTLTFTDTTKNQGAGAAPASTTTYYLSINNATLDAADIVLGSRAVAALAAGAPDTGSIAVTIPADTPSGTFYLYVKADADGTVGETSEFNNTNYKTLRIGPDLLVTSLGAPSTAGAGGTITVTDTTRNVGGGAAPASNTRYYLSRDYAFDGTDVPIGSRPVAALAAGGSDTGSATLTIPAGTAAGSYYLLARADGDDAIVETTETNNSYGVFISIGPDLVVTSFTGPPSVSAGGSITLSDTTRNQGAGASAGSTATYYLSINNPTLDAADIVLGSRFVAALAPGASDTGSVTVTIPAGTPAGTFYLYVKADADGTIGETQEFNNTNYRTIQILP